MGKTRSTRRRQQMFAMVESCLGSGMTKKQFCHEHGISRTRFYYWKKRYQQEQKADAGFLPVQIRGGQSAGDIEILYPNGVQVRLGAKVPLSFIHSLITSA